MNFLFLGDSEDAGDFSCCSKLVAELSELSVVVTLSFLTLEGPEQFRLKFNNITDSFQIQVTELRALHRIHFPFSDF